MGERRDVRASVLQALNKQLRRGGVRLTPLAVQGTNERARNAALAVFGAFDGVIQAGPLEGTRISKDGSWGVADLGAIVLGCYEAQLHDSLEELVGVNPDVIVNIGSADGIYAVGLARRLPDTTVIAVDIDADALEGANVNARLNDVQDRVRTVLSMTPADLEAALVDTSRPVVFLDCEGAEDEFVDLAAVPSLARCHLLIEIHDDLVPGVGSAIKSRLADTHNVTEIIESGRDPHQYEILRTMSSIDKWLVVCEFREQTMTWLWCEPK